MEQAVTHIEFDRASGIGGSDIAAILGASPWRDPFDVWLEKTHDPTWNPQEQTARMRLGILLEPALREAYQQDHPGRTVAPHWSGGPFAKPIWHRNGIAYAHLDGVVSGNEEGIWEGKSAGDARDWAGGVPEYYEAQVRQYLAITEEPWCDVTVLFLNQARFAHYRIEREPALDDALIDRGERFWREYVETRTPPPWGSSEAAGRYLANLHPVRLLEPAIEAPPEIDALGKQLALARLNGEQITEAQKALENEIKAAMGEHARMRGNGWSVLWKPSKGATKVAWEQVATSWRSSIVALRDMAASAGVSGEALQFFTDEALDAIVGLYTTTGAPTHPFRFTVDDKEDS